MSCTGESPSSSLPFLFLLFLTLWIKFLWKSQIYRCLAWKSNSASFSQTHVRISHWQYKCTYRDNPSATAVTLTASRKAFYRVLLNSVLCCSSLPPAWPGEAEVLRSTGSAVTGCRHTSVQPSLQPRTTTRGSGSKQTRAFRCSLEDKMPAPISHL